VQRPPGIAKNNDRIPCPGLTPSEVSSILRQTRVESDNSKSPKHIHLITVQKTIAYESVTGHISQRLPQHIYAKTKR
jgi:hypothetical protein